MSARGAAGVHPEFLLIDGRQVHLRTAGRGPPIVLMHDSPRSSLLLLPLLEALQERFTVYALDTPGFGYSDPLPYPLPTIEHLAMALRQVFDALGIERAALYGTHTSAKTGLVFATQWPERVSGLLLDGISVESPAVQRALLEGGYLKGFEPTDDGAHLVALWLKMRDQFRFFPYYHRTLRARLHWPMPAPAVVQKYLMDLLFAGPEYGRTYAAAFRHDPMPLFARLSTPTDIVCREDDVLYGQLARLPPLPESCRVYRLPADPEHWRRFVCERLANHAAKVPVSHSRSRVQSPCGHRRYVSTAFGRIHVRSYGALGRPAVLLLPQIPGVGATLVDLARVLGERYRVWLLDLPGCGDSTPAAAGSLVVALATAVQHLLEYDGAADLAVMAPGEAAGLAIALAASLRSRVRNVVLDGWWTHALDQTQDWCNALPDLEPRASGGHLIEAWQFLRDAEFSCPWYDGKVEAIRRLDPHLDAEHRHAVLVDLFKQPDSWVGTLSTVRDLARVANPVAFAGRVSILYRNDDPGYRGVECLPPSWKRVQRPQERNVAWAMISDLVALEGK